MKLYGLTIFVGAFLVFLLQPMIGKFVLPWFGGSAAVWTTSLVFFQISLLVGYGYAHFVASRLRPRTQTIVHGTLLAVALLALPITPSEGWKPDASDDPVWRLFALLTVTVGAPFLMLSSTSPLLQAWAARARSVSPYRLYALSNAGSLLALISYPLLFERLLSLNAQTRIWSLGYAFFAVLSGAVAWRLYRLERDRAPAAATPSKRPATNDTVRSATTIDVALWVLLPAAAAVMLLATTSRLTQDIPAAPFFWVLVLGLYLLTFIITFDSDRWYRRTPFTVVLAGAYLSALVALDGGVDLGVGELLALYSFSFFFICMSLHGELSRLRPHPSQLTLFYLMVAAGGALGGVMVAMLAPAVLDGFWEYQIGLVISALLITLVIARSLRARTPRSVSRAERRRRTPARTSRLPLGLRRPAPAVLFASVAVAAVLGLTWRLTSEIIETRAGTVASARNFYGALRIEAQEGVEGHTLALWDGQILHGVQPVAEEKRGWQTTYYGPQSGVGIALAQHPRRATEAGTLRIGVVGLGTGTLAAYAGEGDSLRFYEINPQVLDFATTYFSYSSDATSRGADVEVLLGDARIVMERQREADDRQQFDVLGIDAFSSDAIPIHLLTLESFELYWEHLKPDGILAIHITNRYLDLTPVVRKLAALHDKVAVLVRSSQNAVLAIYPAEWVLVTSNSDFLASDTVVAATSAWPSDARAPLLWTDDHSDIISVLK
jgi:spermidine synthase